MLSREEQEYSIVNEIVKEKARSLNILRMPLSLDLSIAHMKLLQTSLNIPALTIKLNKLSLCASAKHRLNIIKM